MGTDRKRKPAGRREERRRFGRFAARLPLRTRREDAPGQRSAPRLQLRDFSLGGLRLESLRPLNVNERVTVSLPADGHRPPVYLTGRVIHCHPRADRYEVGLQFHDRETDARRSPFVGLPRLFSLAAEFGDTLRPLPDPQERF